MSEGIDNVDTRGIATTDEFTSNVCARVRANACDLSTVLFEIITSLTQKPSNHVTVVAENSWESLREIISCNSILQDKNKETVTVMLINSEDP